MYLLLMSTPLPDNELFCLALVMLVSIVIARIVISKDGAHEELM